MMSWMNSSKPDPGHIQVPEWVRYIAQDSDGSWWGYSVEPLQNHRGWYENELGEHIKLMESPCSSDWRHSLFAVSRSSNT